jgi:hypothetical protein
MNFIRYRVTNVTFLKLLKISLILYRYIHITKRYKIFSYIYFFVRARRVRCENAVNGMLREGMK